MNKRMVFILVTIGILLFNFFGCGIDQRKPPGKEVVQTQEKPGTKLPKEIVGKDGAPMVLIPASEFQMGDALGDGPIWERPVHKVYLAAFYMDKYEVTNALYQKFIDATGHKAPVYWMDSRFDASDLPVMKVAWHDAKAYCDWAGKRLPTEAEWEKAARGGLRGKRYPWGNGAAKWNDANYKHTGYKKPSPVGSFPANGYGLYDMAGNVWEWCADRYDRGYYSKSPYRNPKGPNIGDLRLPSRVVRGGGWPHASVTPRVALRHHYIPIYTHDYYGFRCAASRSD